MERGHTHTRTHIHANTKAHTHTHTNIHTCSHTRTHARTHTHTTHVHVHMHAHTTLAYLFSFLEGDICGSCYSEDILQGRDAGCTRTSQGCKPIQQQKMGLSQKTGMHWTCCCHHTAHLESPGHGVGHRRHCRVVDGQ